MTVIACKVQKDCIEIASDTQTSWGGQKYPFFSKQDNEVQTFGKLMKVNDMIIGGSGSTSDIGLIALFAKTHHPKNMEKDSILEWFLEFREYFKAKTGLDANKDLSIHMILIRQGKAFAIFDFLDLFEIKDFNAVGSGMFLAMGAMENGANVKKAVMTAIKYDKHCGGEIEYIKIPIEK